MENYRLYINGALADVDENSMIAITYEASNYENPTAVKNSFSKTVKLKGTNNNHQIFGNFWKLDRSLIEQSGGGNGIYFDPRKRCPFELYLNAEVVERGYISLDSVSINANQVEYNITLYGSLGDFFYNLAYSDDGEQRTLADLNFGFENEENDILFELNSSYVKECWNKLSGTKAMDGSVSDFIVPIPTYSGLYDDFDSNKILVDTSIPNFTKYFDAISGHTDRDGYILAESQRDMSEWEARDLRSNYQRVGIKLSKVLDAIADPSNNGGYDVQFMIDKQRSNSKIQQYIDNSYILLDRPNFEESSETDVTGGLHFQSGKDNFTLTTIGGGGNGIMSGSETIVNNNNTKQSLKLVQNIALTTNHIPTTKDSIIATTYPSTNDYDSKNKLNQSDCNSENLVVGGIFFSVRDVYDQTSQAYFVTTYVGGDTDLKINDNRFLNTLFPLNSDNIKVVYSNLKYEDGIFKFNEDVNLILNEINAKANVIEQAYYICKRPDGTMWQFAAKVSPRGYNKIMVTGLKVTMDSAQSGYFIGDRDPLLGKRRVSKKVLFSNCATPLEFLTSFTKLFNLRYFVDIPNKSIKIMPRSIYYEDEVVDISDKIDWGSSVKITPTLTKYKYYKYSFPDAETYASRLYAKSSSTPSGSMLYSTAYNFNKETNDLFANSCYSNYLMYCLSSSYFNVVTDNAQNRVPTFTFSPTYKYSMYNAVDGSTTEGTMNGLGASQVLPAAFDAFAKVCAFDADNNDATDLKQSLVFFNGCNKLNYNIIVSDTINEMLKWNGAPCYLYTETNSDFAYITNVVPVFSKYYGNNVYDLAYDFSKPIVTFANDSEKYNENCTLIADFWNDYLGDLYDKDTKQIEISVRLYDKPYTALRKFYWFENSLWILAKLTDYTPTLDTFTKCTFVKVKSKDNYFL